MTKTAALALVALVNLLALPPAFAQQSSPAQTAGV